ncbi:hypothetical protein HC762_00190 [bacterium]|nr:hypothetical protein [bacterium]
MDAADAFWAARIMSRFSDEILRAIVAEADITDPEAERYLADVIIKRRDKIVMHWIVATNPLDAFIVTESPAGWALSFDNAAIRVGAASDRASYQLQWTEARQSLRSRGSGRGRGSARRAPRSGS